MRRPSTQEYVGLETITTPAVSLLCVTFTVSGFIANFVRISLDHGYSRLDAVWFASATGIMVIVGRLTCGYLLDRLHGPIVGAA